VADASLMPTIPSAHLNLTTIMMGERFGAWMKSGEM
jgi:choline dehydrogenase